MTNLERKRVQMQLEILRRRKDKADSLGPEAIAKSQGLYDMICGDIRKLEKQLAAGDGGLAEDLLKMLREIINMEWWRGALLLALKTMPGAAERLHAAEYDMVAAYNQGCANEFKDALDRYREVMAEINADVNRHDTPQITFMEVKNAEDPFA